MGKRVEGGRWSIPGRELQPGRGELAKGSWFVDCANCGKEVLIKGKGSKCYWCGEDATKKVEGARPLQKLAIPSTPRPESRRHMKLGRPRIGEWRKCKGCGKDIYIRRYRLEQGEGHGEYCRKCYGKYNPPPAPKRKEVKVMITPEERADFQAMTNHAKGKWVKAHLEEIMVDIRSMTKKQVLKRWPFGQSTFFKLMKLHAPELVNVPTASRKKKEEKPPTADEKPPKLSEHEELLQLQGYQMAVREYLASFRSE